MAHPERIEITQAFAALRDARHILNEYVWPVLQNMGAYKTHASEIQKVLSTLQNQLGFEYAAGTVTERFGMPQQEGEE